MWLDGFDESVPLVGAYCGAIGLILEYAGASNVFSDASLDDVVNLASVTWEEVIEKDPDVIIVVDASWSTADEKLYNICRHNATRTLRAVQNRAFIILPFSGSVLGVRIGAIAYNLAEAMDALTQSEILSNI